MHNFDSDFKSFQEVFYPKLSISANLDMLPNMRHVLLYRGCFKSFGEKTMDYEWNICYPKCFRYGFIFAGIKVRINVL